MKIKVDDITSSSSGSIISDFESNIQSDVLSDVPSDVIIQSRIKYGTKVQMLEGFLMEYSGKSSVHGLRYIFQRKRPLMERILWVILFVVSVIFACLVIRQVYTKWVESPVIVGFDETLIPINRIPFPTITICPESKMESDIFNFANIYEQFSANNGSEESLSQEEMERLSAALHICDLEVAEAIAKDLPKGLAPPIGKTLRGIAISKNLTAPFCKWNNRFYLCEHIFSLVATDDGICYQFNGMPPSELYRNERSAYAQIPPSVTTDLNLIGVLLLNAATLLFIYVQIAKQNNQVLVDTITRLFPFSSYPTEIPDDIEVDFNKYVDRSPNDSLIQFYGTWSMEEGYINQTEEAYPLRVLIASARTAFVALLQGLGHNLDYQCRSLRQGYKVYLNSPQNAIFSSSNYFLVRHKQEVIVQIYPVYTTTSKAVREFKSERRQCFFNSERYLRFFRHYSESNCQFECLTNFTISKCGCAKFSMPKPEGVRVCDHSDIACYNEAEDELMLVQQNEILQSSKDPKLRSVCNCLPGCVSLNYNFDISTARMEGLGTILANNDSYDEHPDFMWSRLTVHFKEQQFTAMKRSELYTLSTFIANCGGVLSLFIGFSSLSIVELIYFVTIRLKHSMKMREEAERKGKK